MEIYNEDIFDLLSGETETERPRKNEIGSARRKIPASAIRHDAARKLHVTNLTSVGVCSIGEVSRLLDIAAQRRYQGLFSFLYVNALRFSCIYMQ